MSWISDVKTEALALSISGRDTVCATVRVLCAIGSIMAAIFCCVCDAGALLILARSLRAGLRTSDGTPDTGNARSPIY
jgi:hypothetical protein